MADIDEEKLKNLITDIMEEKISGLVKDAINTMIAGYTNMSEPDQCCCQQVTEVIIRCGSPDAVQVLRNGDDTPCIRCCRSYGTTSLLPSYNILDEESKDLFKNLQTNLQDTEEGLMQKLDKIVKGRLISDGITAFLGK